MGLDVATGTVTFDGGVVLRARMPRAAAPLDGPRPLDGTAFHCRLTFEGDELAGVRLADFAVPGLDVVAAREAHDGWLVSRLGPGEPWRGDAYPFGGIEYRYGWGTVGSYAIPQDLDTFIEVSYR